MNILNYIWLILTANAQDVAAWTDREIIQRARAMRFLLLITVAVPVVILAYGIRCGALGEVDYARTAAATAGLMAAVMLTLFMVRASFYALILVLATTGANKIAPRIPVLDSVTTEKFMRWLWGVSAWIILTSVAVQIIPFWEDIGATVLLATVGLAAVAVTVAGWYETRYLRHISVACLAVVGLSCLYSFAPQGMKDGVNRVMTPATALVSSEGVKVSSMAMRRAAANGINVKADDDKAELTRQLLKKLQDRQAQIIREDLVAGCTGFCTPEREEEHRLNQSKILAIQDGTFWESALSSPPPKPAPPAPPPPVVTPPPAKSKAQLLLQEKYPQTLKD